MKILSRFLYLLKTVFFTEFATLNIAELRQYDWDGVFPRRFWHGWCDFWGEPYQVTIDNGSHVVEGGWVDVRHLHRLPTACRVTGTGAGAAGRVDFIFQAAYDLINTDLQWFPNTLRADAMADGTTEVFENVELDVEQMSYIRIHSINNMGAVAVVCRVTTPDIVRPINTLDDRRF